MDIISALEAIIASDTTGLLNFQEKPKRATANSRMERGFKEILEFFEREGREPSPDTREIAERKLGARLRGFRASPSRAAAVSHLDTAGLLAPVGSPSAVEKTSTEDTVADKQSAVATAEGTVADTAKDGAATSEEAVAKPGDDSEHSAAVSRADSAAEPAPESAAPTLESILASPEAMRLLDDPTGIFDTSSLPKPRQPKKIDDRAQRIKAEDFAAYEELFKQKQREIDEGTWVLAPFGGEDTITPGRFFELDGLLVFVAEIGKDEVRSYGASKRTKQRLRAIFSNHTESSMFRQSLSTRLYEKNGHAIVRRNVEAAEFGDADVETGHVYVLSSKSENPEIASLDHAFKIGFTRGTVADRVAHAVDDPTFLYAPVTVERDYRIYNARPSQIEHLLHRVFAPVRLDIAVPGSSAPSEWFIVPLEAIDQAIEVISTGEITDVLYDKAEEALVRRG